MTLPSEAVTALARALDLEYERSRAVSDHARGISRHCRSAMLKLGSAMLKLEDDDFKLAEAAMSGVPSELAAPEGEVQLRSGTLSSAFENFATLKTLRVFHGTGTFPALEAPFTDDEYVGGLLQAAQELARHGTRSATVGNVTEVVRCRDIVDSLNGALLQFEFRNGNLRRKYDGLKYALRRLVDILYVQSLIGNYIEMTSAEEEEERAPFLLSLEKIGARFKEADEAREKVIKQSRDVQKCAKQAIFAAHRNFFYSKKERL